MLIVFLVTCIIAIIIGIIALIIVKAHKLESNQKKYEEEKEYLYKKKEYFFTKNELFFYRDLLTAIEGKQITVFPKTRMADIIEPMKDHKNSFGAFGKIKSKHVDFLLCSLPQAKPIMAIELDDWTHHTEKRNERDKFVDETYAKAGLPILHVYNSQGLKEKIENILK